MEKEKVGTAVRLRIKSQKKLTVKMRYGTWRILKESDANGGKVDKEKSGDDGTFMNILAIHE